MKFQRSAPRVLIFSVAVVVIGMAVLSNRLFSGLTSAVEQDQFELIRALWGYNLTAAENRGRAHDAAPQAAGCRAGGADPAPLNLRTRVHEYGGRPFTARDGVVVAVEFADQRLYRLDPDGPPLPLTPDSGGALRYADLVLDLPRGRVLAVREDHRGDGEPVNTLVAVPLTGGPHEGEVLAEGHDFFAYPRPSPDGSRLAWLSWDHPDMPWDRDHALARRARRFRAAAGPDRDQLRGRREPGPAGVVAGWRAARRVRPQRFLEPLPGRGPRPGAGGAARARARRPALAARGALVRFPRRGHRTGHRHRRRAARSSSGSISRPALRPRSTCRSSSSPASAALGAALVQALPDDGPAIILSLNPADGSWVEFASAGTLELPPGLIARAEHLAFASAEGRQAFALYYPPTNPECAAPAGELPPLVVRSHGGPTGRASPALNLQIQFWTSRGFAVVDVDYAGSTGYGRAYRSLLDGQWGIADVEDCVAAARHLAAAGRADPARLAIRGGSAGGYTTLCALTFHDLFRAGASYYGIGDLEALLRDTHKFESRYLDRLIGPWPEAAAIYRARSPLHHVERLSCPVIFLQGLDDKVVPPNQAEAMVAALRAKGVPVAYLPFPGEGHGFRAAAAIERALLAEHAFFCRVFGIPLENSSVDLQMHELAQ